MTPTGLAADNARVPATVVLACAEKDGCGRAWSSTLRDHALVLRTHGSEAWIGPDGAIASLLRSQPIERIVVLGHAPCRAREDAPPEPMQNLAAIAAYCRLAPAVRAVAAERAAGRLALENARAKLDALVRRANLESCAELHAALERGSVEVITAVYDGASDRIELLDGLHFRPLADDAFRDLVVGATREPAGFHALPSANAARAGREEERRTPC